MGIGEDLADCLGVDVNAFDPSVLVSILVGFTGFVPDLVDPLKLVDLIPNLTPAKIPGLFLAPVAAQIPVPLGTKEIPAPPELGIEIFGPQGLIDFTTGLAKIAIGIPGLFGLSLDPKELIGPPIPIPSPPSLDALVGLIAVSIGLTPPNVDPEFPSKFARCLAKIIGAPLGL